jgi:hypothetical protein
MIQIQKCPENRRSAGGCIQADWIRARIVPSSNDQAGPSDGRTLGMGDAEAADFGLSAIRLRAYQFFPGTAKSKKNAN